MAPFAVGFEFKSVSAMSALSHLIAGVVHDGTEE
jgi:hypothetical protein